MKKIVFRIVLGLLMISVSLACATHGKRIKLADGSIINGEIVSFSEGKYTVKSPSLGVFQIDASKVRTANPVSKKAAFPPKDIPAAPGNPNTPNVIAATILDPDFQAFLKSNGMLNTAKPPEGKTSVASEESGNAVNNPTPSEIDEKAKEQKSNP